jgi:hypothetical protein
MTLLSQRRPAGFPIASQQTSRTNPTAPSVAAIRSDAQRIEWSQTDVGADQDRNGSGNHERVKRKL